MLKYRLRNYFSLKNLIENIIKINSTNHKKRMKNITGKTVFQ